MNKFVKNTIFAASALMMFSGCVHDDDYDLPPVDCNNRWEANTDISTVKGLNDTAEPFEVTTESVLEGYVISKDETGNFYKSIVIQDDPANPTAGMTIEVDVSDTYIKYPLGSRVLVDLQGLYVSKDRGSYKVGTTFTDNNNVVRVGRMPQEVAYAHVAKACDQIADLQPVSYSSISEAMDESHVNTLIRLENVQFQTVGENQTYYVEDGPNTFGGATNVIVVDSEGETLNLRTSQYASFAADVLPDGSGSLTAVLSAYSSSNNVTPSTYQLFIRNTDDVNFDQPRFEVINGEGPVGGTSASYAACVTEDFDGFSADLVSFENYINYAYNGDRYWTVRDYDDNNFLQMSAYNSGAANDVYFIIPVDFDNADEFSFASKMRYYNGEALKVYYSTDYEINGAVSGLNEITSEFTLSDGSTDDFVASGNYDLSSISGTGAIFFKYEGVDGSITTTVQLDDISIVDLDNDDCESNGGGDNGGGDNGGDDGTNVTIPYTEDFASGIPSTWTNLVAEGERTWQENNFDGVYYVKNSAYSSGEILDMEAWLITPAFDFDTQSGESLDLAIADAFNNGNTLKIYYSSNYTDGAQPSTATWTEIGANEINGLPTNSGTYDNQYDETSIDLSSLTGSNHIAFVYDSEGGTVSTTIQIANVGISAN